MSFTFTPQLGLLIGGIVGMIIGWLIGFFDSNNRTAKKIREAEEREEHAKKEMDKRITDIKEQYENNANIKKDDPGLLRIKNEGGSVVIEMDGMPLKRPLPPNGRKRLIDLVTVLRPFIEGKSAPVPSSATMQSSPRPVSPPPAAMPAQPHASPLQNEDELIFRLTPPEPVKPIEAGLGTILSPQKKEKEEKPAAPLSIVGQIDSVLQKRLANSPLAGRGIKLQESPDGSVQVLVGEQTFPGIDEVPDDAIKAAIRAAVTEWENNSTPGIKA